MCSSLENIPLPPEQKNAMLQLIDGKINNDMKEVIAEIRSLEGRLESKIQMLDNKIQLIHDKLSNEIKVVYWVVGIAMAVMIFVVARK
jgi:hypothetical protein